MAINTIKTGRPMRVPQPSSTADFVPGSKPASLRAPAIPRIKPMDNPGREYGKPKPAPFAAGPTPFK
jgi:hypothetical protein